MHYVDIVLAVILIIYLCLAIYVTQEEKKANRQHEGISYNKHPNIVRDSIPPADCDDEKIIINNIIMLLDAQKENIIWRRRFVLSFMCGLVSSTLITLFTKNSVGFTQYAIIFLVTSGIGFFSSLLLHNYENYHQMNTIQNAIRLNVEQFNKIMKQKKRTYKQQKMYLLKELKEIIKEEDEEEE